MTATIEFQKVSKRYRLGMTRTSLPTVISGWAKSAFRKSNTANAADQFFWALRDVSFELERGDSLGLVGANGAGKTTTLKLLAKITKPTSGQIHVNGKLSALIELGAGFHPDLSGRENIFLNGAILGLNKADIQRRFDSIVDFSELDRFIDTPVKRYSSGMAVRLGFAVAASINPDILLVDEVLAVGDTTFRIKCVKRIQELIDGGTTLIFVSHNMGLVKSVCKKGLYIEKGTMKLFGDTDKVIEAYNRDLNQRRISQFSGEEEEVAEYQGSTAEITKIEVLSLGPDTPKLMPRQPAEIVVHYNAYQDLGEVVLFMRITRSDGVSCCKLNSDTDQVLFNIRRGVGKITITLDPLQLFPSTYQVSFAIKNKAMTMNHDVAYSDWFYVEGEDPGHIDLDAVFEPNKAWAHEPQTSNEMLLTGREG